MLLRHRLMSPPGAAAGMQVLQEFSTNLWLDRILLWTNVYTVIIVSLALIVYHACTEIAHCYLPLDPEKPSNPSDSATNFVSRYCGLQLNTDILQGFTRDHSGRILHSLHHQYYPFYLMGVAMFLWLPELIWQQAVRRQSRRNLLLIRNELSNFREFTMSELNRRGADSDNNLVDFSASVSELPQLHSCQIEWSLQHYLSRWQCSEFLWRRYITKHSVLLILHVFILAMVLIVLCVYRGVPFGHSFQCQLPDGLHLGKTCECVLPSSFIVNASMVVFLLISFGSVGLQFCFFYYYFGRSKFFFQEERYLDKCFFGSFIKLVSFSFYKNDLSKIRGLHVGLAPGFTKTDFHFMSLLCEENQHLLTDIYFVHFWTERFLRANQQRQYLYGTRIRRRSCDLLRSEDMSFRLNFSKLHLKLELTDLFF